MRHWALIVVGTGLLLWGALKAPERRPGWAEYEVWVAALLAMGVLNSIASVLRLSDWMQVAVAVIGGVTCIGWARRSTRRLRREREAHLEAMLGVVNQKRDVKSVIGAMKR